MEMDPETAPGPFRFSNPKLVSQKFESQIIFCDTFEVQEKKEFPCILKFFPPRAKYAYERELAVYSIVASSEELQESVLLKLWSGNWSRLQYRKFLGTNLPRMVLQKSDRHLSVLALPYIQNTDVISNGPDDLRLFLIKTALHSLRRLHTNRIAHGDVSVNNLLIQREECSGYSIYWIDFSSSTVQASIESITHEWDKAVQYFSDLVNQLFLAELIGIDKSRSLISYSVRRIGAQLLFPYFLL